MRHLSIKIHGDVQGVFFRHTAREIAERFSLTGIVYNELDGSVYIEAEGAEENLNKFLEWCRIGPFSARVDKVLHEFSDELKNFADFSIK